MRFNAAKTVGIILLAFGSVMLLQSFQIVAMPEGDVSARIFPILATSIIVVLGFIELLRGWRTASETLTLSNRMPAVLGLIVLSFVYIILLTQFGYLIATGLSAPLVMALFGCRSPLGLCVAALLCPVVFHLIFFMGLGVFPPYGNWFDLLYLLQGF